MHDHLPGQRPCDSVNDGNHSRVYPLDIATTVVTLIAIIFRRLLVVHSDIIGHLKAFCKNNGARKERV